MTQPTTALAITPRHYEALCGLALAAMFLLQMQQNIALPINLLMLLAGVLGILYQVRLSPIVVLLALAAGQLFEQYHQNEFFNPDFRSFRFLDVSETLLCAAVLTYLIGLYRLQGLRFGVLPRDDRQPSAAQRRSATSLSATELMSLVMPIPLCALLAEFACFILKQHWTLIGLPPRWKQFLLISWLILLAMFVAAHGFRYWRRLQMDRATAQLLLQDELWNETRGEQRRLNRWIAWKKLKETD